MPVIGIEEIALDDGRKLKLDLHKVTILEFRFAVDEKSDQDKSDAIVAKTLDMAVKDLQALSQPDYRRVVAAFWRAATQPLEEKGETAAKNSPSESTSD